MLFLEGVHSLGDRKALGNVESSLLPQPPASTGRKPVAAWELDRPHFTEPSPWPQRPLSCLCWTSLWLLALVCFQPGLEPDLWRRFPGVAQKPLHIWLFSWLQEVAWE